MYLIASDLVEKEAIELQDFPMYRGSLLGFQFGTEATFFFSFFLIGKKENIIKK